MSEYIYGFEFEDSKNRTNMWYVIALSVVIWITIWWFLTKQYGLSFIVLLISWLIYYVENNSEDIIKVYITEKWINIDKTFYDFSSIKSFCFVYNNEKAILLRLNLIKKWLKYLDLKIDDTNKQDIENILQNYLEQREKMTLDIWEKLWSFLKL